MTTLNDINVVCLCGKIDTRLRSTTISKSAEICHCEPCRHSTGLLYSSYYPVSEDEVAELRGLDALGRYQSQCESFKEISRYFCKTCGAQVLRILNDGQGVRAGIATGTISAISNDAISYGPQINTNSPDGGLFNWMKHIATASEEPQHGTCEPVTSNEYVSAGCLCGKVVFRVTPPSAKSREPKSGFADTIIPFYTNDPEIKNPNDVKWWLRQNETKYMAALCACKSCRLASGFEIQSWAFVPRVNIEFKDTNGNWEVLDFDKLHERKVFQGYDSSPGVQREFCTGCGATLFWHDKWRPDLIDISVGLFYGETGSKVEELLDWFTDRISFAEDARIERHGQVAECAQQLIDTVGQTMKL